MKKFAFISLGLPPSQSGQSMVISHLLKDFNPASYCLITLKNFNQYNTKGNCSKTLPAQTYFVNPDYQILRIATNIAAKCRVISLLNLLLRFRVYQYKKILLKEKCTAVVGCTGDLLDPPAAFIASRDLNLPFILYAFDYYSRQWTDPILRSFADSQEEAIVHGAAGIIAPNECLGMEYLQRYGIHTTVIHNPFDLAAYEMNISSEPVARDPAEVKIVYTGAVYEAHYSAVRNLISAIKTRQTPGLKLHIYTPQSEHRLETNGISGPVVIHKHLPNNLMANIQHEANLLFLPLAFGSGYPDIIRTSAPGKMGEYLASGTPVLVHAPKDSFVSWYFEKYRCGLVVAENDPTLLAKAIEHLTTDEKLCKELTQNARIQAKTDFNAQNARRLFIELINKITDETTSS